MTCLADLTPDRVLQLMREVVNEHGPEFTYQEQDRRKTRPCWYVRNGRPDCLIGHVFHRADVSLQYLAGAEGKKASIVALMLRADGDVAEILDAAQEVQDDGGTWGHALARAELRAATLNDRRRSG